MMYSNVASGRQCLCVQQRRAMCAWSPCKVTIRDALVERRGGLVGHANDRAVGGARLVPSIVLRLGLHVGSDAFHV